LSIEGENSKATPVKTEALSEDKPCKATETSFNHASIVGMLKYLQGRTRQDVTIAISKCSRYIH